MKSAAVFRFIGVLSVATVFLLSAGCSSGGGESSSGSTSNSTPSPSPGPSPSVPSAPTGLSATPSNAQVALAWSSVSGAASYKVKRATTSGGPYSVVQSNVTSASFNNTGLTNGTMYYYVVSAVNATGESVNSSQVSARPTAPAQAPTAPTGLTAAAGNAQVSLSWAAVSGASSYRVKRATTSGGPYTVVQSNATTTNYTNTGLTNGTVYYFVVSAVNAVGEGANSGQVSATPTAPSPVTGWPDETNTGVLGYYDSTLGRNLQYSDLQPMSGEIRVTVDGTVLDKKDIDGCVLIFANNVTIRRSRIRCASNSAAILMNWGYDGYTGTVVEYVEIDGKNVTGVSIAPSNYVVRRSNMYGSFDGPRLGNNVTIEDSYIHDLATNDNDPHNDGIQSLGGNSNIVIRHNNIANHYGQTSCILMGGGNHDNVLIENNLFNGGGYSLYADFDSTNMRYLNNRFGRRFFPKGGYYGPVTYDGAYPTAAQWSGNVWDDTGLPVNP